MTQKPALSGEVGQTNGRETLELINEPKLSLACGQRKPEGFFGVDIAPGVGDAQVDLLSFPWPIKDRSVRELECSHFVEHIPHWRPGWQKDGWWLFFEEVYRICKRGATCRFTTPYVMNGRAFWDPTHERFVHEATWLYLSKQWREEQGLDHYPTHVNFEVLSIEGTGISPEMQARSLDQQQFARTHYWNVVHDLVVLLRVIK